MRREELLARCLSLPGAWLDEPWSGEEVVKVGPRIFAFLGSATSTAVGLKCGASRQEADEWLARYPQDATVMPHVGRSGWNSLRLDGAIPAEELLEALEDSYAAVVARLPLRDRPVAAGGA